MKTKFDENLMGPGATVGTRGLTGRVEAGRVGDRWVVTAVQRLWEDGLTCAEVARLFALEEALVRSVCTEQ